MEGRERAEFKDKIVQFLLTRNGNWSIADLHKALKYPLKSPEHLREILNEMNQTASKFFAIAVSPNYNVIYIAKNPFTQDFQDNGGFLNQYESDLEADIEAEKLDLEERDKKKWELIKLKTYWIPIAISLGALLWSIYNKSTSVSQADFDKRVKQIESSQKQLQNDLQKDYDSVKDELYKAKMLIGIYEADKPN